MFNRQTKMEEGPHCSGSRTDIAKVKTWAATSQIYVKVRQILSEKVQLNANTNHKCTPGTRSLHNNNVKLFTKSHWKFDQTDRIGDEMYLLFVNEHLKKGKDDFSDSRLN